MSAINKFSRRLRIGLAKLFFDKKAKTKELDISKIDTIAFIIHDGRLGDTTIATLSFREIKKKYPDIKIAIICTQNVREILKYNRDVDEICCISGNFFKDIFIYKQFAKLKKILLIDFFEFDLRLFHFLTLRILNPYFLIGFYKSKYKFFNKSFEQNFNDKHFSLRHKLVLNFLNIDNPDLSYNIKFSKKEIIKAKQYINLAGQKFKLVLNPFASSKHRTLSIKQIEDLIFQIQKVKDVYFYILCPYGRTLNFCGILADQTCIVKHEGILSVAALISFCDFVISPDTSIIHIASAFNKKTIGLYLDFSDRAEKTDIIWGPNNINAKIINVDRQDLQLENDVKNIEVEKIVGLFLEMTK
ncbi:MAG: hypothetical protein LBC07_05325 [Elusimicrobiota bacterium]|nr:hypothetical protein [Elusimicrobiota bacterium]